MKRTVYTEVKNKNFRHETRYHRNVSRGSEMATKF